MRLRSTPANEPIVAGEKRLPIGELGHDEFVGYSTPRTPCHRAAFGLRSSTAWILRRAVRPGHAWRSFSGCDLSGLPAPRARRGLGAGIERFTGDQLIERVRHAGGQR